MSLFEQPKFDAHLCVTHMANIKTGPRANHWTMIGTSKVVAQMLIRPT